MLANITLILGGILLLVLSMVLLYSNAKSAINRSLFGFTSAGFVWLLFNLLANVNLNSSSYLFFLQLTLIGAAFLPYFFLLFCYSFVGRINSLGYVKALMLLLPVVFINSFVFTAYNLSFSADGELQTGQIYIVLILMLLAYFGRGLYLLIQDYKQASVGNIKRTQLQYIFWGISLSVIPGILLNAVLPILGYAQPAEYGANVVSIFALFTSIAIIKHKLFDIRFVVVRSLGYALSIAILAGIYAFVSFILTDTIFDSAPSSLLTSTLNVVLILFVAITFAPLKGYFDKLTNSLFYKDAYDTQEVLTQLNRITLNNVEVDSLLGQSVNVINGHLKTSFCTVELRETSYRPQRFLGDTFEISEEDMLAIRTAIAPIKRRVIITSSISEKNEQLAQLLAKYDIGAVSKMASSMNYGLEGIGLILFGIKKSGNAFNKQDKDVIGIISSELTIATQNALRFEEIENFNVTLQQKVDDATKRLKKANEKLKALDETKDEFISMASHQLRTPLTSVKGYMSMVLEGDAGELNETQRKFLEQAFVSSQRMVYLIADLLNLSRLRTGKFVIEPVPSNLADLIEGELNQLTETAGARHLKLNYKKPANFPTLMLDETKIRQVIMNFVDNAIYYTPTGGNIDIVLKQTDTMVEFTVQDSGIGVPKSEQPHLFNKFYRAKNAQKARPDGTGLGLFMAKKVIVAQGGAIIFSSQEGKGSTFGFTFSKSGLAAPASSTPSE